MKNLLVLTDFSPEANHAVDYAYSLAVILNADLILCNAIKVPAELPMASFVAWPMEEASDIIHESDQQLKKLRSKLQKLGNTSSNSPKIKIINQSGSLKNVAENVLFDQFIDLTIMGAHGAGGMSELILGSQSRYMIDYFEAPVLLVPLTAIIKPIKKIVFAIDFHLGERNKEFIHLLVPLAKALGAEIYISHIHEDEKPSPAFDTMVQQFMFDICSEIDTVRISYRSVENYSTMNGLEQLMLDGQMDLLVMIHQEHSLINSLLLGSLTKRMASAIDFPLLVFKKTDGLLMKPIKRNQ